MDRECSGCGNKYSVSDIDAGTDKESYCSEKCINKFESDLDLFNQGYNKAKSEILEELKGLEEYYHVNPLYPEGMEYWVSLPDLEEIIEKLEEREG